MTKRKYLYKTQLILRFLIIRKYLITLRYNKFLFICMRRDISSAEKIKDNIVSLIFLTP